MPAPSSKSAEKSTSHGSSSIPILSTKICNIAKSLIKACPQIPKDSRGVRGDHIVQEGGAPSISFFKGSSNVHVTNSNFDEILGDAIIFRFDGQFTEIERNLIGDYIAKHIIIPAMNDNLKKRVLTKFIRRLPCAEAVFNDYQIKKNVGPCFKGTRVMLLREVADWVTGQEESRMCILSGPAGIGKSTVAYTFASRAADLNLLAASFFFSRDDTDRNSAKRFFTTIAYQLCVYNESFAEAIGAALRGSEERGSAATMKEPQEQLQTLILNPLQSISKPCTRPVLVIVDALDECCEDDVRVVIEGLGKLVCGLPSFKVILTTCLHPVINHFLVDWGHDHKHFRLQDIEADIVNNDIGLYLKHGLSQEKVRQRFPNQQWCASDEEINLLVHAAERLFIIASTAVMYILDKVAANPAAQMHKLLNAYSQGHMHFKDLDRFYTIILRNVVPEDCDDDIVNCYQSVVCTIILIQPPLPVSALSHLIGMDMVKVHGVLDNLQSVISIDDDDVPRISHKSFSNYLINQRHCRDARLKIDPKIGHTQIAKRCVEIMNTHLEYNILGLDTAARCMRNKDALKQDGITYVQLQEKIPQQLHYASVHWGDHLKDANTGDTDLLNGLKKFVDEHTLHWFEILSLIEHLDTAHRAISVALNYLKSTSSRSAPSDSHRLFSDALNFISKFYDNINRSALYTYYCEEQ